MIVNKTKLADILGKAQKTLTEWQKDGLPVEETNTTSQGNKYDTAKVIQWMIDKKNKKLDYNEERTRLTKAQADRQEIELQILNGDLLNNDDVLRQWTTALLEIKTKMLSMPTRASVLLDGVDDTKVRKKILTDLVREALGKLTD